MIERAVIWITGRPAAGKSTLGRRIMARLRERGEPCALLDSDDVREALGRPAGQGRAERDEFYDALARLAALLARQGLVVIVPATAHQRAHRERARALAPAFIEVHVRTPADECERRDPKGLYARARAGTTAGLPGVDEPYEDPTAPEVVALDGEDDQAVSRVLTLAANDGRRAGQMHWKKICCGIDFSEHSRLAMDQAAELARMYEAELTLVHVHEAPSPASGSVLLAPPELFTKMEHDAARQLESWRRQAEFLAARPVSSLMLNGDSAAEILRYAREELVELIVMGTHGRTGLKHLVLGSVAERVSRQAECPVLVVRVPSAGRSDQAKR